MQSPSCLSVGPSCFKSFGESPIHVRRPARKVFENAYFRTNPYLKGIFQIFEVVLHGVL